MTDGSAMTLRDEARAKVNLTLRVVGRRPDGYHELESVVAFADCADHLTLQPGAALSLTTIGPGAQDCGDSADNLVLKAARLLGERVPDLTTGAFTLDKHLPVAAGIGGGSADAAAALRLLARANDLAVDDPRLIEAARLTGADVPVCLPSKPCVMTGVGEKLSPLPLPRIPAVMVNPRVPVATKDVLPAVVSRQELFLRRPPVRKLLLQRRQERLRRPPAPLSGQARQSARRLVLQDDRGRTALPAQCRSRRQSRRHQSLDQLRHRRPGPDSRRDRHRRRPHRIHP